MVLIRGLIVISTAGLLLVASTSSAATANPQIDTTFSRNGIVSTDIGAENWVNALIATDTGVTTVGTTVSRRVNRGVVMQYLDNGALNPAFGSGGIVLLPKRLGRTGLSGIVEDASGAVVVTGYMGNALFIGRLTGHGHWDHTFSSDGWVAKRTGGETGQTYPAIDSKGRIVVGTSAFDSQRTAQADHVPYGWACTGKVFRVGNDGTVGQGFGRPGLHLRYDIANRVTGIALDSADRVLVEMATYTPRQPSNPVLIVRLQERAGTPDASFGPNGRRTIRIQRGAAGTWPAGFGLDGAGRIVGGLEGATNNVIGAMRLSQNGGFDPTYGGGDGKALATCRTVCAVNGMLTDQGYLLFGESTTGKTFNHTYLARFTLDGASLDPTFGAAGQWTRDLFTGYEVLTAGQVDPLGRIVLGGEHASVDRGNAHLLRLLTS